MNKRKSLAVLTLLLLASACATPKSARVAAVDYNRAFAAARNEVLLLNILRASVREPLQFSHISQVSGSVDTTTTVTLPFGFAIGEDPTFEPEVSFETSNPDITIVPSETKEFVAGINRPIPIELVDNLTAQNVGRGALLSLVFGGFQCTQSPVENTQVDFGDDPKVHAAFQQLFGRSTSFNVDRSAGAAPSSLVMTAAEAAEVMKDGVGDNFRITKVTVLADGRVQLDIAGSTRPNVTGLGFTDACAAMLYPELAQQIREGIAMNSSDRARLSPDVRAAIARLEQQEKEMIAEGGRNIVIRSVRSMIYFLGQLQATYPADDCGGPALPPSGRRLAFSIRVACQNQPAPTNAVISTRFRGRTYYVPASPRKGGEDTLELLSILSELLAAQTTAADAAASRPAIVIAQ